MVYLDSLVEYNIKMKRKLPSSKKTVTKRQLELEAAASYEKLLKKWEQTPKFARSTPPKPETKLVLNLGAPPGRTTSTVSLPSRITPGASTSKKEILQYTGTKMLGIGQMHKSNSVPIFSKEDAIDVSKMRRN